MNYGLVKKGLWRAILLYIYAFLGGCIFYIIERKPESSREIYTRLTEQLHQNFTAKFNISMNQSDFELFMKEAFSVVKTGKRIDWTLFSGLSFTMMSLTTIGFGNITPETPLGQIITIVYCIVGIPICLAFLKTLGETIAKVVEKFVLLVERKFFGRRRPKKLKTKSLCLTFILMVFTLCLGGLTQIYLEDWSFVEGIYAFFAMLSTIGYGDYIPWWSALTKATAAENKRAHLWLILSALALPSMAGLCVVSAVINSLVDALDELKIQIHVQSKCLRCERKASRHKETVTFEKSNKDVNLENNFFRVPVKERLRSASI